MQTAVIIKYRSCDANNDVVMLGPVYPPAILEPNPYYDNPYEPAKDEEEYWYNIVIGLLAFWKKDNPHPHSDSEFIDWLVNDGWSVSPDQKPVTVDLYDV